VLTDELKTACDGIKIITDKELFKAAKGLSITGDREVMSSRIKILWGDIEWLFVMVEKSLDEKKVL